MFARGTFEPPGVGGTGEAFVDSLRSKLGSKSLDVYPVDYPASLDFQTAADGVIDASNRVQAVAAECPNTKIVLGGFSQGAAVAGYLTADSVPAGFAMPAGPHRTDASGGRRPRRRGGAVRQAVERVPADDRQHRTADHGRTSLRGQDADVCIPEDPICSPGGGDNNAHNLYPADGLTDQAADFVAQKVLSSTPKAAETAR